MLYLEIAHELNTQCECGHICKIIGACLVCSELGSVCAGLLAGPAEAGEVLGFVCFEVANSKIYCSMSVSGYLFGPEP